MIHPTAQTRFLTAAALALATVAPSSFLATRAAADEPLFPWPVAVENHNTADFLATALPVAGNKGDLENEAPGFFRAPEPSAHEPATILYVGFRAERAPVGSPYRAPLFSGSVESFDLGLAGAQPAPQTVGDIGEIYPEDAPPTPMAYIVYRLDFGTRGSDFALFATPAVTSEPFTTSSPGELDSRYAWEAIRFSNFATEDDHENDFKVDHAPARARLAPEPTSAALLGLGFLGLVSRRRRRS